MVPSNETPSELMTRDRLTVPDHQIGQPTFAINFVARPDGVALEAMALSQAALAADLPAGVFTCPLDSLHLTVVPVIWARGTYDFDVRQWWESNAKAVADDLAQLARESGPFELKLKELDVLPGAIVARFEPSSTLDALRQKVHEHRTIKDVLVEKIDFTHVTLLRFEVEMPLFDLSKVVARHDVPRQMWSVDHLILCQEETYPSLVYQDVARLELR